MSRFKMKQEVISRPFVDEGVVQYGRGHVQEQQYSVEAGELITDHINAYNNQTTERLADTEIVLPEDVDPRKAVLWLGKAFIETYGNDVVLIDSYKAGASNRATGKAIGKLRSIRDSGLLGMAFLVEHSRTPTSRGRRVQRLSRELSKLSVPTLSLRVVDDCRQPATVSKGSQPSQAAAT